MKLNYPNATFTTQSNLIVERTSEMMQEGQMVTYFLHDMGNNMELVQQLGVSRVAYEILVHACNDMLEISTVVLKGELTAAELAGEWNKVMPSVHWCTNEAYKPVEKIRVIVKQQTYHVYVFYTNYVAKILAEFEVLAKVPKNERFVYMAEGKVQKEDVVIRKATLRSENLHLPRPLAKSRKKTKPAQKPAPKCLQKQTPGFDRALLQRTALRLILRHSLRKTA